MTDLRPVRLIHRPSEHPIPWQVEAMDGLYLAGFRTAELAREYMRRQGMREEA